MHSSLSVILLVCSVGVCLGVKFKDCGSKEGILKTVTCTGDAKGFCQLKKGTNVSLEIDFKSKTEQKELKNVVHGILGPVPISFNTGDSDACHGIEGNCPIHPNKDYHFKASFPVKAIYPAIKLVVEWEIKDIKGIDVICVKMPAQIID